MFLREFDHDELAASRFSALFCPVAQQTPDHDQLPEVVGVVVGDQQRFPQDGLPVPVRNRGEHG